MGIGEFVHGSSCVFNIVPLKFVGGYRIHGTMVTYGDRDGFVGGFFFVFVAGFAEVARGTRIEDTVGGRCHEGLGICFTREGL